MTPTPPTPHMLLVTVKAAAKMLSLGESTVYAMIAAGDLPYVAVGRVKRIALSDIEAWIARSRVQVL
jgi:excisionase family DNA binding protein